MDPTARCDVPEAAPVASGATGAPLQRLVRRFRRSLLLKFLLVFLAVFLLPLVVGLWSLVQFDSKAATAALTARIGNQSARAALAIERHGALTKPELARDLLAPMAGDVAVECINVGFAYRVAPSERVITGLECGEHELYPHELVLPIGDGEATLMLRFTDKEVLNEARRHRQVLLGGLVLAVTVAVFAVSVGFRQVVGTRTHRLHSALVQIARGGAREPVAPGSDDELGRIIDAFNRMIEREAQREAALQRSEDALRGANDHLALLSRESEQRFRDLVTAASDWYWEMDEHLRFSYFSDRFTEITGVPKGDLLGKTRQETGIPNVDASAWHAHIDALANHRPFRNFEHPRTKANGELVWLSISGSPTFDEDGKFRGYRGTGRDITQRELAKALKAEKEVSEQLARTKGEFLANMSHEIRTPINGVLGMTELLLRTSLNPKQHRFASTIRRSGEALLRVINDILDFSKIEAGKLSLHCAPFDLRELMEDLGELFAENAHSKGVELVIDAPVNLHCKLKGDVGRMRQVLTNLIGNAIKFTDAGEVVVRVSHLDEGGDGISLRFEVRDTGIGIPEDSQSQIFDSFAQVDGSTHRRYGGTGLGLAISAALVRLMDGEIGLQSMPEQGSTFWFTVRMERLPAVDESTSMPMALHGRTALVVDDNPTSREILQHQLAAWGMHCLSAPNGPAALELLESRKDRCIDVAVLDMNMPRMDGLTLARRLRERAEFTNLPMAILSSVSDGLVDGEPQSSPADALLMKPVRQGELRSALESLLVCRVREGGSRQEVSTSAPARFHGRVLLAEDNPVNQEVALSWLEPMALEVTVAASGSEAVSAWQRGHFDLILMDCQMPELNGFEATGIIRAREASGGHSRIPIVALTANALAGDRERCLEAGMDGYLSKPYTGAELMETLGRWLNAATPPTAVRDADESHVGDVPETVDHTGDVLDYAVLAMYGTRASSGRPGALPRIVNAYLEQSAVQMQRLHQASISADTETVRAVAHMLKSSSAQVGAMPLSKGFAELEQDSEGCGTELVQRIAALDALHERVCEALAKELKGVAA